MAEIRLQEGELLENALRRFKRKVQSEDIIKEVKRHSYYLKPGAKSRVKSALARKRARKKIRRDGSIWTCPQFWHNRLRLNLQRMEKMSHGSVTEDVYSRI